MIFLQKLFLLKNRAKIKIFTILVDRKKIMEKSEKKSKKVEKCLKK